jgi:transposase
LAVFNGRDDATALVGINGIVIEAQLLVVGCAGCGTRAVGHGRTRCLVRDLAIAGVPCVLVFKRRRWKCPELGCDVNTWSEHHEQIPLRTSLTRRARQRLADMVNSDGDTIAAAATDFGVGWHTANAAVTEHTDPHIDDPSRLEGATSIGVDEKRFLNATAQHRTVFTTQIVDLDSHRVLDVIEGRTRDVLDGWLRQQGPEWCARISLATLDPAAGYRRALIDNLPNAVLVVDHFHAIKLANTAIDDVRRRTQNGTQGHLGRKGDPLYRGRRLFLTGWDRLTPDRIGWMFDMLAAGDPDGEVGAGILAKELLREVYNAVDTAHAKRRLITFFQHCAEADVHELKRLARTIDRWNCGVLAYHATARASNGRVENIHMLAEKTRRCAHGFTNQHNYRRRLIGRYDIKWDTVPTRRIRGRQPHPSA